MHRRTQLTIAPRVAPGAVFLRRVLRAPVRLAMRCHHSSHGPPKTSIDRTPARLRRGRAASQLQCRGGRTPSDAIGRQPQDPGTRERHRRDLAGAQHALGRAQCRGPGAGQGAVPDARPPRRGRAPDPLAERQGARHRQHLRLVHLAVAVAEARAVPAREHRDRHPCLVERCDGADRESRHGRVPALLRAQVRARRCHAAVQRVADAGHERGLRAADRARRCATAQERRRPRAAHAGRGGRCLCLGRPRELAALAAHPQPCRAGAAQLDASELHLPAGAGRGGGPCAGAGAAAAGGRPAAAQRAARGVRRGVRTAGPGAYWMVVNPNAVGRPEVDGFCRWVLQQAEGTRAFLA